jgi:hypothetical protein
VSKSVSSSSSSTCRTVSERRPMLPSTAVTITIRAA